MNNNNDPGIDWDGELTALMESSGINRAELVPPSRRKRVWRWLINARAAFGTVAATVPLAWLVSGSGAPAAAQIPLLLWLAGWIGYGIWISAARPDLAALGHHAKNLATVLYLAGSRQIFEHSRPARARWRAWRADRTRATATATL